MRNLLTTSGLGALAAVLATPAAADQTISTAVTTPVATNGQDITITSTGSVKPSSGAAVTINSSNSVTNQGAIAISGANNSTGILADTNLTGIISNTGTITIDETYAPSDTNGDGVPDGPFAQGTNRFGIHVLPGGTFTGAVNIGGDIKVKGNHSAAVAIDSTLAGSLTMTKGTVSVLGDNSVGIRTSNVTGNVQLINGAVAAQGANSIGVDIAGDVGGSVSIQNAVSATGYSAATAPADTSKLGADNLLQGGPAVAISGNVAHGIIFDAAPTASTTNTDVDGDGIPDASEGTAAINSYGSAPAVLIGSATADTTVGVLSGSSDGLVTKGAIGGQGVYTGVSATGIQIGGLGHNVTIDGGMTVGGGLGALAINADATALRLGAGAHVPAVKVTGIIQATGGGTATTGAQAISIDAGASVASITNSGSITASLNGTDGTATAIVDRSGTVGLIQNSGTITVTNASTLGDNGIAIDLRANSTGATVQQIAGASGSPAPSISGNILFGG
ncbi:MAG: autotransporter domain-containing protein, partial [Sphingomonas sp.]|nr:autotransporter domain-containing protein [Sphingomonas sp.]